MTKLKNFFSMSVFSLLLALIISGCQNHSRPSSAMSENTSDTTHSIEILVQDPSESSSIIGAEIIWETVSTESHIDIEYGSPALYRDKDSRRDYTMIMGNGAAHKIPGILMSYEYALNRDAVAMLFDAEEPGGGRLLYSDGTAEKEIAKNVLDYRISDNGKAIVYLVAKDAMGEKGDLHMYSDFDAKSQLIFENVHAQFCVSPDGETVVFVVSEEEQNQRSACFLWKENEPLIEVSRDMVPIAVSNCGRNVYFLRVDARNSDQELWAYHEGKLILLSGSLYQYSDSILINSDGTQILYDDEAGLFFFEKKEPVILSKDKSIEAIDPNRSSKRFMGASGIFVYNTGADSLRYTFFEMRHRVGVGVDYAYIDNANQYIPIVTSQANRSGAFFRHSDSSILFTDLESGKLMYIPDVRLPDYASGYSEKPGDVVSEDVHMYDSCLTSNGTVFYTDGEKLIRYDGQRNEIVGAGYHILGCYPRPGAADIIFLCINEEPKDDPISKYISFHYFNLYIIEDAEGSEPILIEENVGQIFFLEDGVYYLSLKEVANGIRDFYSNPDKYDEFNPLSTKEEYDHNNLKYSVDGASFKTVAVVERIYLQGG